MRNPLILMAARFQFKTLSHGPTEEYGGCVETQVEMARRALHIAVASRRQRRTQAT